MSTKNENNTATALHLSALSQYFFPFGNFIFPIIIWSSNKERSAYIDNQGKQCINFQLSIFTYSLILALIAIPIFIITIANGFEYHNFCNGHFVGHDFNEANVPGIVAILIITAILFAFLKVAEFFLTIYAAVKTSNGENYKYPMTIPFLKYNTETVADDVPDQDVAETEAKTEA